MLEPYLLGHFSTVHQNAAARLIFRARRYDHVQPLLWSLHWLRVPERISFRLAVLVYRCLHGSAPGYLASDLQRVSDLGARRRLRSSSMSALVAPRTVRATIGDRAFPAAAASEKVPCMVTSLAAALLLSFVNSLATLLKLPSRCFK